MTTSFDSQHRLGLPLLIIGVGIAGTSHAQQQAPAQADPSPSALETITVTAQRRSENQQDVPIAVSALSANDIFAKGISSTEQLQAGVPALTWTVSQFGSPFIRGIGTQNVLPGSSLAVPLYVDGVLQVSPQQSNFPLFAIERIEVLKGPQGTLFGRNATGGVVNILTRDPSDTPSADVEVGYGDFQTTTAQFYGNVGITDTLSTNLAVSYFNQGEGWGDNLTTGETVYRERNRYARWKIGWTPNEDTSWVLGVAYGKVWSDKNTRQTLEGFIGVDGSEFPGWWNTRSGQESYFDREVLSVTLNGHTDTFLGDFYSITGYSEVDEYWSNDVDAVEGEYLYADYKIPTFGFTQEFRLASHPTDTMRWQAGVFYQWNRSSWDPLFVTGTNLGGAVVNIISDLATSSWAAYGDATWTFASDTNLTLGARYSIVDQKVDGYTLVNGDNVGGASQSERFDRVTWRAVLDHHFTSDLMGYASISTGFNQGTFNSTAPAAPALESETVTSYELGAKSEWMDSRLRLNANVYFAIFKNLQTQIVTDLLTEDANVGEIEVKGFEFELLSVPVDGLTLGLNYNFNDATYKDYENAVCVEPNPDGSGRPVVCNANGNQVRVSPKHSVGASVMYDLESSIGNFSFALSDSYKSEAFWDYSNTISNDAYHLVSAMIRYAPHDAMWAVSLRGSNLTNSEYWTEVLTRGGEGFMGTPASPRTYSMNVEMHF